MRLSVSLFYSIANVPNESKSVSTINTYVLLVYISLNNNKNRSHSTIWDARSSFCCSVCFVHLHGVCVSFILLLVFAVTAAVDVVVVSGVLRLPRAAPIVTAIAICSNNKPTNNQLNSNIFIQCTGVSESKFENEFTVWSGV